MKDDCSIIAVVTDKEIKMSIVPNVAISRWTRFCWWLSRQLGGIKVFGKQDLTQ